MKVLSFIVCDDIRHEIGNKISLMGIYDSSIEFKVPKGRNDWPKIIKLGFFIRILKEKNEENPASFTFKMVSKETGAELGKGKLPISQNEERQTFTLALVNNQVSFAHQGNFDFIIEFYNEKNELIEKLSPEVALKVEVHEK